MTTLYDERRKGRKVAADAVFLDEIEPPAKGRRILSDRHRDSPRGFGLRVYANGTKAFVLRYQHTGRDRQVAIGEYPTWSLSAAREQAKAYRQRVDAGEDIVEERRAEQAEPTVSDVCHRFIQTKRKAGMESADDVERLFKLYLLPEAGQRKIALLRRRDVIAIIEHVADHAPRQASMLLSYTKQMVAWAEDREIVEANPVATLRGDKITPALAGKPRARVLDAQEIRDFWNNAESVGLHRLTALALKLVLLTGQRSGEVAGMRWSEVEGTVWTIPGSRRKTRTPHTVPLSETALQILERARTETDRLARRRKQDATDHIFQTRPGRPVTTAALSRAVIRYPETIGNKNVEGGLWRPHDLRRTCRTGLAAAGIAETVAEAVIGHTRQGIVAVYDRHRYEREKRKALEAWERRLLRIAAGEPVEEDNVISMAEGNP